MIVTMVSDPGEFLLELAAGTLLDPVQRATRELSDALWDVQRLQTERHGRTEEKLAALLDPERARRLHFAYMIEAMRSINDERIRLLATATAGASA